MKNYSLNKEAFKYGFSIEYVNIYTSEEELYNYFKLNLESYYNVNKNIINSGKMNIFCVADDLKKYNNMFEDSEIISYVSASNHEYFNKKYFSENEVDCYYDSKDNYIVFDDYNNKNIVIISDKKRTCKNCKTVIRDQILYGMKHSDSAILIHGAGAIKDEKGFVITGNKRAGKTTTMINFLRNDFDFCSNDLSFVKEKDGKLVFKGVPESIRIGVGTLSKCDELKHLVKDKSLLNKKDKELFGLDIKYEIEWDELAEIYNCEVKSSWNNLDFVICLSLDISLEKPEINMLTEEEKDCILSGNIMSYGVESENFWLQSLKRAKNFDEEKSKSLYNKLKKLPFIAFNYSGSYREIDKLILKIEELV